MKLNLKWSYSTETRYETLKKLGLGISFSYNKLYWNCLFLISDIFLWTILNNLHKQSTSKQWQDILASQRTQELGVLQETKHSIKSFQLFTAANVNAVVLWFVVPCNLVVGTNISEKMLLTSFQSRTWRQPCSSETAMFFYKATWRRYPVDKNINAKLFILSLNSATRDEFCYIINIFFYIFISVAPHDDNSYKHQTDCLMH
jgi:hypothetical protein